MIGHMLVCATVLTSAWALPFFENADSVWAVLVAGTYGFTNYRHQADVAHAYNVLLSKGVAPEHIITFSVDDIAYNELNPFKGALYNDYGNRNFYENLLIDYSHENVTWENFLWVLQGDPELKAQGMKVLESGPNCNVFIYYSGRGGLEFITFPNDILLDVELNDTLTYMYREKIYSKMLVYVESSLSGSMFEGVLSPDINAYAMTASASDEHSYATFCDDHAIPVCLSNEFSYNWMSDSEESDITNHTVGDQFECVRNHTVMSTVHQYGSLEITDLCLCQFQGGSMDDGVDNLYTNNIGTMESRETHNAAVMQDRDTHPMSELDISLRSRRLNRANKLADLVAETMQLVVDTVSAKPPNDVLLPASVKEVHACFRKALKYFSEHCFSLNYVPAVAEKAGMLADLCRRGHPSDSILRGIGVSCL